MELRVVGIDGSGDRVLLRNMPAPIGETYWDDNGRGLYLTLSREGADNVHYVDLDGVLFLARDRQAGMNFAHGRVCGLTAALWG